MIIESWNNSISDSEVIELGKEITHFLGNGKSDADGDTFLDFESGKYVSILEWVKLLDSVEFLKIIQQKIEEFFNIEMVITREDMFSVCAIFDKQDVYTKISFQSFTLPIFLNIVNFLKEKKFQGFKTFFEKEAELVLL